jgi:hypothetical protein
MIIRNARVLTFDSAKRVLDSAAVEILPDGSIGQVKETPAGAERSAAARQPPSPYGSQTLALRQLDPTEREMETR